MGGDCQDGGHKQAGKVWLQRALNVSEYFWGPEACPRMMMVEDDARKKSLRRATAAKAHSLVQIY